MRIPIGALLGHNLITKHIAGKRMENREQSLQFRQAMHSGMSHAWRSIHEIYIYIYHTEVYKHQSLFMKKTYHANVQFVNIQCNHIF